MGEPLDSTRQTRYPSTRTADSRSQQTNHREVESAVLWLQEQLAVSQQTIATLEVTIEGLTTRLSALEQAQADDD